MWRVILLTFFLPVICITSVLAQPSFKAVRIADINPGPDHGHPGGLTGGAFKVFRDTLFFRADDGMYGSELFKYDGNRTHLVADIHPGKDRLGKPYDSKPRGFVVFKDELLFRADDGIHGRELFAYDGQGVRLVADINPVIGDNGNPNGSYPAGFTILKDMLVFKADDGSHRMELFTYDGEKVRLLADLFQGRKGSRARDFTVFKDAIFFSANDGLRGRTLFTFDGFDVSYVTDVMPGMETYNLPHLSSSNFTLFNESLYFRAEDIEHGTELFAFDGDDVRLVANINAGEDENGMPFDSNPTAFVVYKEALFFSADDGIHGQELFTFEGDQVRMVADIRSNDKSADTFSSYPSALTVYKNMLIFSADDAIHGAELFLYDGAEVRIISDIFPGSDRFGRPNSSDPRGFTILNDTLIFTAEDSGQGGKIFMFDGTDVRPVSGFPDSTISPGNVVSSFRFTPFNGALFFSADDGLHGQELWQVVVD